MKSILSIAFVAVAMFGFVACGSNCNKSEAAATDSTAVEVVAADSVVVADTAVVADTVAAE